MLEAWPLLAVMCLAAAAAAGDGGCSAVVIADPSSLPLLGLLIRLAGPGIGGAVKELWKKKA